MSTKPKAGDAIRILPSAIGTASEYAGETVTIVDITLDGEIVWFRAHRDLEGYDAPLTEDEWEAA